MTTDIDLVINTIMQQYQVKLAKDDPLLLLPVINKLLIEQSQAVQAKAVTDFQTALTNMLTQLEQRNQTITQTIISRVQTASQDLLAEQARKHAKYIADGIEDKLLQPLVRRMQYYAYLALIGGTLSFLSVGLALVLFWLQLKLY